MKKYFLFGALLCAFFSAHSKPLSYYTIDGLYEDNGVIKLFYTVLHLLDQYDNGLIAGFEINFNENGKHFNPERGKNWWQYYFTFDRIGSSKDSIVKRVPRYKRSTMRFNTVCTMPKQRAHYLIRKYISLQSSVQKKFNCLKKDYWPDNKAVIGVYYQNPIMIEAQKSWTGIELCDLVKKEVENKDCIILLCTALDDIVRAFKNEFGSQVQYVSCLKNNATTPPDICGEHALLTILLLAECDEVIAPGSYQSIGVQMLNPTLPIIELDTIPYAQK